MVDMLMLASLGDTYVQELLALSQEYDVNKKGRTQSFFSDRTIYDATAFTQTNADGGEAAYLGHVIVGPNGRLGFDPSVVLAGEVPGGSFHQFFAGEIAARHDAGTILANLLAGDDVVVADGPAIQADGFDGDDVLLAQGGGPGSGNTLLVGGAGDDLIFLAGAYGHGGSGADRFVADSNFIRVTDLERGSDRILLDRTIFADVGTRITRDNFHVGEAAQDADDRLIARQYYPDQNYWELFVDPDGVGGVEQQRVGFVTSDQKLTFRDFGMVDADKLMPDISRLFDRGASPFEGFGTDHAGPHAGFLHADATPLLHHGLVQLA